jgi:Transglutaminase-like superfamily
VTLERLADPRPLAPWTRLALALEVLAVYARAWLLLRRRDVRTALALLRRSRAAGSSQGHPLAGAARLGQIVSRVLKSTPAKSRCLMMSVVLSTMLARRGVEAPVVIGVRSGSPFGAHAWAELDGHALLPAGASEFERLVTL